VESKSERFTADSETIYISVAPRERALRKMALEIDVDD
jgi:hypothetical protein